VVAGLLPSQRHGSLLADLAPCMHWELRIPQNSRKSSLDKPRRRETNLQWDMVHSPITIRRSETWLEASESGYTIDRIAAISQVTPQYVRRLIAMAKRDRSATPETTDPLRLELTSGLNPKECLHSARSRTSDGWVCLECEKSSVDGLSAWVLVQRGPGSELASQRLESNPRKPPNPAGPTTYHADPSLKGGRE
jgi:hypothetical protein